MSHYSLEVRTLASHAEDPGSIPGGGAKTPMHLCAWGFLYTIPRIVVRRYKIDGALLLENYVEIPRYTRNNVNRYGLFTITSLQ